MFVVLTVLTAVLMVFVHLSQNRCPRQNFVRFQHTKGDHPRLTTTIPISDIAVRQSIDAGYARDRGAERHVHFLEDVARGNRMWEGGKRYKTVLTSGVRVRSI